MAREPDRIIDMTLQGDFVAPPMPPRPPLGARIVLWAVVAAVLAISVLIVALTLWFVVMLLPLLLGAALVAYLAFRYQMWRGGNRFIIRRWPGSW